MTLVAAIAGGTDPDDTVDIGYRVAEHTGEDFVGLHVIPQDEFDRRFEASDDYYLDDAAEDAATIARRVVRQTLGEAAEATFEGRIGSVATEIVEEADRRDARYLVVGGRKRSPVGKAVFGSVTQAVLLEAACPVITVPKAGLSEAAAGDGPVVAAVDRSDRAERVVDEGARLADAFGNDLHVVHVAQGSDDAESVATDAATAGTPVGLSGEPSEELLEYAEDEAASFLVTAGRKRTPVGKVLFGSVTQSVLLRADRPVVSVMAGR